MRSTKKKVPPFNRVLMPALLLYAFSLSACNTTQNANVELDVSHKNISEFKKRGKALLSSGKEKKALQAYKAAMKINEKDAEARYGLAETYLKLGDFENALIHYKPLAEVQAYNLKALQGIGLLEIQRGNPVAAQEALTLAVTGDDTLWRAWNGLGQLHDYQKSWEKSSLAYKKALENTPDEHIILNNMGVSFMAQERFKDAEKTFSEALRYKPDLEVAQTNHKLALAMQKKYNEATIESDVHERSKALNNTGYAAMLQGDYHTAEKLFIKAVEVNPSFYKEAYSNLQVLHQLRKD